MSVNAARMSACATGSHHMTSYYHFSKTWLLHEPHGCLIEANAGKHVSVYASTGCGGPSTISLMAPPAGTIGYTFSNGDTLMFSK